MAKFKYIAVPTEWVVYKVADDVLAVYGQGATTLIPPIVLEMMTYNGQAQRLGKAATLKMNNLIAEAEEVGDEETIPLDPESGMWYGGQVPDDDTEEEDE